MKTKLGNPTSKHSTDIQKKAGNFPKTVSLIDYENLKTLINNKLTIIFTYFPQEIWRSLTYY